MSQTSGILNIEVTVTDFNGCQEIFNELHFLQFLPDLDITNITDGESFCVDDADPSIGLTDFETDGDGAAAAFNAANVTAWTVNS